MGVTMRSLAKVFYETNSFGTYPTDLLANCSGYPIVARLDGKLHRVKEVFIAEGALVLDTAKTEYKRRKRGTPKGGLRR